MRVPGLIMSFSPNLSSAMVRFPFIGGREGGYSSEKKSNVQAM